MKKRRATAYPASLPFVLVIFVFAVLPAAHSYLDPASAGSIINLLIAALVGGLFAIKSYWQRLKNWFSGNENQPPETPTGPDAAAQNSEHKEKNSKLPGE